MSYYIYMLRCDNNSIYTGIAKDFQKRYAKHINGEGAKYTKIYRPIKIERVFLSDDRSSASKVEKFIQKKNKIEKELYIKEPSLLIENILKSIGIKITEKKF